MQIFNTLTRKKEEFVPLEEGKVKMYVCGPTVYNLIHIGNARPMIVFDTVRRYLEYKGYDVNFVSNFTDVDDKTIKKANEEGVSAEFGQGFRGAVREAVDRGHLAVREGIAVDDGHGGRDHHAPGGDAREGLILQLGQPGGEEEVRLMDDDPGHRAAVVPPALDRIGIGPRFVEADLTK